MYCTLAEREAPKTKKIGARSVVVVVQKNFFSFSRKRSQRHRSIERGRLQNFATFLFVSPSVIHTPPTFLLSLTPKVHFLTAADTSSRSAGPPSSRGSAKKKKKTKREKFAKNKIVRSRIRESLLLLLRAAACLRHRDRCVHVDTVISVEDCGCGVRVGGVGGRPNFARRLCFADWDEPVAKYFCKTKKSNLKTQKRWPAHAWSFDWCSIKRKF